MSEMMATANAKSIEEIKSFLSRQKEVYKIPYETPVSYTHLFVHCPHSEHDMGVGIMSRRVGVMDGKVSNHPFGNKLLFTKLPDKDSVLVRRYLSGDGKHPPSCKLGVPLFLHRFGGVP